MKRKWLVISYDTDKQWTYRDHVLADATSKALEFIGDVRPYAIPIAAFQGYDLIELGKDLDAKDNRDIRSSMKELKQEAQS